MAWKASNFIETSANTATLLVCGVLLFGYLAHGSGQPSPRPEAAPAVGTRISLKDIGPLNDTTLLLFLRTDCHFCTASAGFYKRLIGAAPQTPVVAVFGEPTAQGRDYLTSLDVAIPDVRQAPHRSAGVSATPVALLVDRSGVVKGRWIGLLDAPRETEVLQATHSSRASN